MWSLLLNPFTDPARPFNEPLSTYSGTQFVQVDAGHLKGKWKGVILVATGKDTNNSLVVLAYCICDKETEDNYSFFFRSMKENPSMAALFSSPDTTIYSDEHKSIKAAVNKEAAPCIHRLCLMHLVRNLPGPGIGAVSYLQQYCVGCQA